MANVHEEITIHAPADDVWELAGDPGRISEWLPLIIESSAEGDRRYCTTQTGDRLVERITDRSDEARRYSYEIVESPMPLRSYTSQLAVEGHDDHTHVTWVAEFEAEAAEAEEEIRSTFAEVYRQGLESLRDTVEPR
jgi:carbon monoxide dehydrogenase subunit G